MTKGEVFFYCFGVLIGILLDRSWRATAFDRWCDEFLTTRGGPAIIPERDGAEVARPAHTRKVAGSSPAPAPFEHTAPASPLTKREAQRGGVVLTGTRPRATLAENSRN